MRLSENFENFEGLVPLFLSLKMKDDFLKSDYETLTPKWIFIWFPY